MYVHYCEIKAGIKLFFQIIPYTGSALRQEPVYVNDQSIDLVYLSDQLTSFTTKSTLHPLMKTLKMNGGPVISPV